MDRPFESDDNGFPEEWETAFEKASVSGSDEGVSITNDHGILYMTGGIRDGEWMHTMDQLPAHLQNRR